MSDLTDYEYASFFFRLPAEIRLKIYSYLIPVTSGIEIDLCTPRRPDRSNFTFRRRSIVSNLLHQTLSLDLITRTNGLHLLLVSRRTRSEILPLLSEAVVRFHCPKCFEELLRNLSFGFGVGVKWMKHVQIVVDLAHNSHVVRGQTLSRQLGRVMATEAMYTCRKTAWLFYGRLDLSEKEEWKVQPLTQKRTEEDETLQSMIAHVPGTLQPNGNPLVQTVNDQGSLQSPPVSHLKWLLVGRFYI